MKVTRDKTENSQAFLTIEMEPPEIEEALKEAYHHLVQKANIPGFRKGKAPRAIVERYLGKESLMEHAVEHMVPEAYEQALIEQKIEPVAQPQIEIVQNEPLIFKATVPLIPTVKVGDYHQIQLTPEPVKVTDEDINAVIEQLRHQHATWDPAERPVEFNDLVTLDVDSTVEGKPFINQKGGQYQVIQGVAFPVSGFAEQLTGMKPALSLPKGSGEEKEFKLPIPADYPRTEMVGKEASFKVRLTEIKQEKLPELTDEFAAQVHPELKTLDALRQRVTEQLTKRAEERVKADFEGKVIEAAAGLAQVEYPQIMVDGEVESMLNQQARRLQMGGIALDDYLKSIKKTEDELKAELRPQATRRVVNSLVLDKIAEEEEIEVTEAEIDAEVEKMATSAGEKRDEVFKSLNSPRAREPIRQVLVTQKTVQKLTEIAKSPKTNIEAKEKEEVK